MWEGFVLVNLQGPKLCPSCGSTLSGPGSPLQPAIVQEINKEENILASLKDHKSYSLSYFALAKTSHMDTQR